MSNIAKKYPILFSGIWFAGFGVVACTIVLYQVSLPPRSFVDYLAPALPSFVAGCLLGVPIVKWKINKWMAFIMGVIAGILAVYLFLIGITFVTPTSTSQAKAEVFFKSLRFVLNMPPFIFCPVAIVGGLAGFSLRGMAKG
jgi:hypothetical protein